jgi:Flp pilus assembly protein TadB
MGQARAEQVKPQAATAGRICHKCGVKSAPYAAFCPNCGAALGEQAGIDLLEIDVGKSGRIWRWVTYVLLYLLVGALIAGVMIQMGASPVLAVALVIFMMVYMTLVGWRTSKHLEKRNKGSEM